MNTSYTLRRSAKPHLFTHMVTEYNEDFETYYEQFLKDKQKAEAADRLYYYEDVRPDSVDVSTTPGYVIYGNLLFHSGYVLSAWRR